jgi:hypothetical protein
MEKENRGSAQNAALNNPQIIMKLYWSGQPLQGYVTMQVAHFRTTHNRYTQEGAGQLHIKARCLIVHK